MPARSSQSARSAQLAFLALLMAAPARAQLGGWTWQAQGCAQSTPTSASFKTCADGCGDLARLQLVAPDSGFANLDYHWTTLHGGGLVFTIRTSTPGAPEEGAIWLQQGTSFGPSWCAPQPPPCTGGASAGFPIKKGQLLVLQLDAHSTEGCVSWDPASVLTSFELSNWSFTPETLPVVLSPVASPAWSPSVIAITGDNFEPASQVLLDGQLEPVVGQSADQLLIRPGPSAPAFHELTITNAAGSTTLPGGLARLPTLAAAITPLGAHDRLFCTIHIGAQGVWWLGLSTASFASPLPIGGSFYYGLWLDPAGGLLQIAAGSVPAVGGFGKSSVAFEFPHDAALSGLGLPLQALATHAAAGITSFTNLALPVFP